MLCELQLREFIQICATINFPIAFEKTCWPTTRLVFLGLLLDAENQLILLPIEKIEKGRIMVNKMLNQKKTTVKELEQLCGFLNFLGRAVVPGRAFTRRLYTPTQGKTQLKPYHHLKVLQEMKLDLLVWQTFLYHPSILARPFIDLNTTLSAEDIGMFLDATKTNLWG